MVNNEFVKRYSMRGGEKKKSVSFKVPPRHNQLTATIGTDSEQG